LTYPPSQDDDSDILISEVNHYAERQLRIMTEVESKLASLNRPENRENQENGARAKSTLRIL
jgi:hypothetical protein